MLPVPVLIGLFIASAWFLVPTWTGDNARDQAIRAATQMVNQYKVLRGYYTKNVVKKVLANKEMWVTYDHVDEPRAIPLPATVIHDMSALLENEDTSITLYSAYPFPNRGERVLDEFQQQAWDTLVADPDQVISRQEEKDGRQIVRVAIADHMVADACVSCHNSRGDSPKTDWKLGDVRRVLEVVTVIDDELVAGQALSDNIIWATALAGGLLVLVISFAARRIARPLSDMTDAMNRITAGDEETEIPFYRRNDEIGHIAEGLQVFKFNLATIRSQSDELEKALASEKEHNEMQRQFVSMVSHEFRTPLTIIDGSAQRILRRIDRVTPEDLTQRIGKIRRAVARMQDLIESTLNSARISAGKTELDLQPCRIKDLVTEVCERQQEISANHTIQTELEALPDEIIADPKQLDHIFTNLLSNAVKYSPDAPLVRVFGRVDGADAVIAVADSGVGIPEDELPNMFSRFFRASTSSGVAGTGIGLNLVKTLVDMHGGRVELDSQVGKGTTMAIFLPIDGPPGTDTEPEIEPPETAPAFA